MERSRDMERRFQRERGQKIDCEESLRDGEERLRDGEERLRDGE